MDPYERLARARAALVEAVRHLDVEQPGDRDALADTIAAIQRVTAALTHAQRRRPLDASPRSRRRDPRAEDEEAA